MSCMLHPAPPCIRHLRKLNIVEFIYKRVHIYASNQIKSNSKITLLTKGPQALTSLHLPFLTAQNTQQVNTNALQLINSFSLINGSCFLCFYLKIFLALSFHSSYFCIVLVFYIFSLLVSYSTILFSL